MSAKEAGNYSPNALEAVKARASNVVEGAKQHAGELGVAGVTFVGSLLGAGCADKGVQALGDVPTSTPTAIEEVAGARATPASDKLKAEFTVTPTITVTAEPTKTATPEPSPTVVAKNSYKENKDGTHTFVAEMGEVTAPEVKGFDQVIETTPEGKQVLKYIAKKGNKQGYEEGKEGGMFNPRVTMMKDGNLKMVGGVVLDGAIAEDYFKNKYVEDKWGVALPVDISNQGDSFVSVGTIAVGGSSVGIKVNFNGKVAVANIIPGSKNLSIATIPAEYGGKDYSDSDLTSNPEDFKKIKPGQEGRYIDVGGKLENYKKGIFESSFGDKVADVSEFIIIVHTARSDGSKLNLSNIVSIGDSPVFVRSK